MLRLFTDIIKEVPEQTEQRTRDLSFVSPLLDEGYLPVVEAYENQTLTEKPLLLYLPGFDGTWLAPFIQFPELSTTFDVRCLTIPMTDRSTFEELKTDVIDFILDQLKVSPAEVSEKEAVLKGSQSDSNGVNVLASFFQSSAGPSGGSKRRPKLSNRPVYIAGESFGGMLTLDVALSLTQELKLVNLKGLVLINPATCYDRSRLASEGPSVARLPEFLYPLGVIRLLPLFADEYSLPQLLLILQSKALPSVIDTAAREAYMGRVAFSLPQKLKFMPRGTLRWRLEEWLETGCARMYPKRLEKLAKMRMLIVAGEKDLTLPSIAEADRLSSIFPKSQVHVVDGAGHASTCGSRVDLAALIRNCFSELRRGGGRTAMKPTASQQKGTVDFGMEPRYDNSQRGGLSPLLYWSKELYRKPPRNAV
jgi:pimeloyl-ACP methyl ester carboxylesterase